MKRLIPYLLNGCWRELSGTNGPRDARLLPAHLSIVVWVSLVATCHGTISGGNDGTEPCADGAVIQACACGGEILRSGQCCSGKPQSYGCDVGACAEGAISSECLCAGELVSGGYCCSGEHKPHACELPKCDSGEVLDFCRCDEAIVNTGFCCRSVHQEDVCSFNVYYVSSSDGSDDNLGTSASLPWKTLDQVNTAPFVAGDVIQFKRGDQWMGTITVSASGMEDGLITYGAYGTGSKPKLYGAEDIFGWSVHSANIYMASFDRSITQLFLDGRRMQAARYPNTGTFKVTSVESETQFTSTEIPSHGADYYKGATVLIKINEWRLETRQIIASAGQTLTIDSVMPYELTVHGLSVGDDFLFVNRLDFLDTAGQWYADPETHTVYFWTPDGTSPDNFAVRGSVHDNGIVADHKDYVEIKDLHIAQFSERGIYFDYCNDALISGNEIVDIDTFGMKLRGSRHRIMENKIDGCNHYGFSGGLADSLISDNEITNTALFDNLGIRGMQGNSFAMALSGNNNIVRYNRWVGAGYAGFNWTGLNCLIEYNYADELCLFHNDGGAIYTYTKTFGNILVEGSVVRGNIVLNHRGVGGIYMDNNTQGVLIENNTVAHSQNIGLFYHDNMNMEARYNTLFDNVKSMRSTGTYVGTAMHHNIVNNIKEIPAGGTYSKLAIVNISDNPVGLDYNTYIDRHRTSNFANASDYTNHTFSGWQNLGQDLHSTCDNTALDQHEWEAIFFNDTKIPKAFYLNGATQVKDNVTGISLLGSFALEPFVSRILRGMNLDCILDHEDTVAPEITAFTIPSTTSHLVIDVETLAAEGEATAYLITESFATPTLESFGWQRSPPTRHIVTSPGTKILYAWARDAAGNISTGVPKEVVVSGGMEAPVSLGNSGSTHSARSALSLHQEIGVVSFVGERRELAAQLIGVSHSLPYRSDDMHHAPVGDPFAARTLTLLALCTRDGFLHAGCNPGL